MTAHSRTPLALARSRIPVAELVVAGDPAGTRNSATLYVRLLPLESRDRDQFAVMGEIRRDVLPPLSAGLRTSVQVISPIGGGGALATPLLRWEQPSLQDLAVIGGFAILIIRSRLKEACP